MIEKPPSLIRIDGGPFRLYETPDGERYPSITSVLNAKPNPGIEAWKKRVGVAEAERVSKRATTHGTKIHMLCEDYLNNELDVSKVDPMTVNEWIPMKKQLDEHIDDVLACELSLFSTRLRVAGTTDLIAAWDGVRCLIDFKTSKRLKTRDDIYSYFLQTSAYAMMCFERTGIVLKDLVILMLVEGGECLIFKEKVGDYIEGFIKLRQTFKELNNL